MAQMSDNTEKKILEIITRTHEWESSDANSYRDTVLGLDKTKPWGTDEKLIAHFGGKLVDNPVVTSINDLKALLQSQGFTVDLDAALEDDTLSIRMKVTGGSKSQTTKLENALRGLEGVPGVTITEVE